jgi:hypothetical protein
VQQASASAASAVGFSVAAGSEHSINRMLNVLFMASRSRAARASLLCEGNPPLGRVAMRTGHAGHIAISYV